MKYLLFLTIVISCSLHAQQWQSLTDLNQFGNSIITINSNHNRPLGINPYNNSVWFGGTSELYHIASNGTIEHWNNQSNGQIFQMGGYNYTRNFAFNETGIYLATDPKGLFRFDGVDFTTIYSGTDAKMVFQEGDSTFLTRGSQSTFCYLNDSYFSSYNVSLNRIVTRNGIRWFSSSDAGLFHFINDLQYINSDTANYLLSIYNYDMKFKRNSDSLYVASELGFSIAYDTVFVDTLTPFNSNMPHPKVKEFEFDKNDNMWAVFSDDNDEAFAVGFYDGSTWSKYYDSTNSPVDWSNFTGIEIDTFNNVWISDEYALHTLKEYQTLDWLDLPEYNSEKIAVSIFPNPSSDGVFQIKTKANYAKIEVYSLDGKLVHSLQNQTTFILEKGVFLVRIIGDNGIIMDTQKVIRL